MEGRMNDYGPVAHLYDTYVRVDLDLPFFREEAGRVSGPVLELTAGTGRVSVGLLEAGSELTCVDFSREMLKVLRDKFGTAARPPFAVCADIRSLPFEDYYHLAVIPFNSFLEITDERNQLRTLSEAKSALAPGGSLICTLHNPVVRSRSFGSEPRLLGPFDLPDADGKLEVWVRETWNEETRVAQAEQTFKLFDHMGALESEQVMRLQFSLIEQPAFAALARETGLEVTELLGDYDRSSFNAESSPYMIWLLRRP
jgi:SAM-dependent methyltransferase